MQNLNDFLSCIADEAGVTIGDAAKKTGLAETTVRRWLNDAVKAGLYKMTVITGGGRRAADPARRFCHRFYFKKIGEVPQIKPNHGPVKDGGKVYITEALRDYALQDLRQFYANNVALMIGVKTADHKPVTVFDVVMACSVELLRRHDKKFLNQFMEQLNKAS